MIKKITVTNYLGDSLALDLADPYASGFAVKSVTGLGPVKATINTTEVATTDGTVYNSARLSSRNIVISLSYLWKPTIEHIRQLSYKYFPIKKKVTLLIETDNRIAKIDGYVESNDPTIFSKDEGSDISIICPNPFFYAVGESAENITTFSSTESLFEFPFCNDSLISDTLEMGSILNFTDKIVTYDGDYEVGVTIHIYSLGPATNISIYNTGTREMMKINTDKLESIIGSGLIAGDEIEIGTCQGNKYIKFLRDGESTNILNCLDKDTDWFKLAKGDNVFAFSADTGANNLQFKIRNQVIYEGI